MESNKKETLELGNMKFEGNWIPYRPGMKIPEGKRFLLIAMVEGNLEVIYSKGAICFDSLDMNVFIKGTDEGGLYPTSFEHKIVAWCEIKVPSWTEIVNYNSEEV